jgi:spore maturation protein CgeB
MAQFGRVTLHLLPRSILDITWKDWPAYRTGMNAQFLDFLQRLHREHPVDLLLTYYSGHQVIADTIRQINALGIVTATFHLDDRLLFRGVMLGGQWRGPAGVARAYDLNLTQAPESLVKYRVEGALPMLWPLAANPQLCYPREVPFRYDVSFAGTAYGNRIPTIRYLQRHGVQVATFGNGWPGGPIPPDRVQEIFCASRINLNFDDISYTHYQCGKLRDFEVPMCGGLMLCTHNPHLGNYFELDREIFTFRTPQECLAQIRRLLSAPELCAQARRLARERALREHTWDDRFKELLRVIGFIS